MTTPSTESYVMVAGRTEVAALGLVNRIEGVYAEEHRVRVRTTEYPVETGAELTDHVVREPYRLKLQGTATEFFSGEGSAVNAWAAVLRHIGERQPVSIVTRLGTYHNMILVDTKAPINESTGLSLDFEMEFKEILRAHVTRGAIPASGLPVSGPALDRATPPRRARVTTGLVPFEPDVASTNLFLASGIPVDGIPQQFRVGRIGDTLPTPASDDPGLLLQVGNAIKNFFGSS